MKINFKFTVNALLIIFGAIVIFHILILIGIVPQDMVWGGRLENASQMRKLEFISIIINLLVISVVAMKGGYVTRILPAKILAFLLWAFTGLFILNTIGNLFSQNIWETVIFTPLTMMSAILFLRLAIDKQ